MKTNLVKPSLNRNDPCHCGSGKKYKKCCLKADQQNEKSIVAPQPKIQRSSEFIEGMRKAGALAKKTLDEVEKFVTPGITTEDINKLVHDFTLDHGAYPAPLNYKGFPKSVCTSLNEVVCHGIPDNTIVKEGDILNVDVTPILDGFHGDTNRTFLVGECSEEAKKITRVSKDCLDRAIAIVRPYTRIGDIGAVIQQYAHSQGCSVVEMFVGHGIGKEFHMEPQVPHFGKKGTGPLIIPGMFFTIEPMINLGEKYVKVLADGWTAVTEDGSLSAQFEHTLLITDEGVEVMTA